MSEIREEPLYALTSVWAAMKADLSSLPVDILYFVLFQIWFLLPLRSIVYSHFRLFPMVHAG